MKSLLCLLLLTGCLAVFCQDRAFVLEKNIALNYQIETFDFNSSFGSRTVWEKRPDNETGSFLAFLEVNQFITKSVASNKRISLGYKYRSIEPTGSRYMDEHRLTQQLTWVHRSSRIRLSSRFRLEQRFRSKAFEHRYRYRFAMDMPLNGEKLDPKECYMVSSNEVLIGFSKGSSIDNRWSVGLGYLISTATSIQIDFTFRSEDINNDIEHIPFITPNLIVRIP